MRNSNVRTGAVLAAVLMAAIVLIVAVASLGGGGSPTSAAVTYAPAAYGQQVGSVFDCYYIDVPGEVGDLEAAGLCPRNSVPTLAPASWEATYYGYYSSPAYYNTYVPSSYRSTYTHVTVTFSRTHTTLISQDESHATYKSSTGQKVTGTSKLLFGNTNGSTSVHGGGAGSGGCAVALTAVPVGGSRGPSGTSGVSHSGTSGRTGSSTTTRTTTSHGTGAQGGC